MNFDNLRFYGFAIHRDWYCRFPTDKLINERKIVDVRISEKRIEQLNKRVCLEGKHVLELGSLEGAHSLMLQVLGVKSIVAVEGRKENFLKCLTVKNAFQLDKCKFLFGDLNEVLPALSSHFDLCLALGVLYHLENPIPLIYRIAQLSDNLFAWSHYAIDDCPECPWTEITYKGHVYRGKYTQEDTRHYLSGLQKRSLWLSKESIVNAVKNAGFKQIEIVEEEQHEHGPAMTFFGKKC